MGSRIALGAVFSALAAAASAQTPAIQFAEPVRISLKSSVAEFDAYGRRFSLSLSDNERVLQKLPAEQREALASYRLVRGSVAGAPGSWVRLTQLPGGVEGAIWDGQELYAVTRYEIIAPFLTTPLDAGPGQTVVYRLSDARDALPADFCALDELPEAVAATPNKGQTALDQYRALLAELTPGVVSTAVTRQIEISLIADTAFQQAEPNNATGAMLARLNIVEGIFSEQVGLLVLATDVRLMPAGADPFTSTKGSTLLEQLSAYRSATPAVRARGLAHLMTGKDLDGTTAGIAYVRTVCERERGVSLSQRSYGTTLSALIMAHELGHNLGAEHDGEPGTSCASTPGTGFIMSPSVSGYATFSQCSIDTQRRVIATASCITPAEYADVTVEPAVNSVVGEGGVPFTLPFTVRSIGNLAAQGAEILVSLPPTSSAVMESATSSLGSCTVSGLTATCALGDLAVNASAQVSVMARGTSAGSFSAQARVAAGNDRLTSNNNRLLPVTLRSGIDARVSLSVSAAEFAVGAPFEVYADVSSQRALPVRNATLSLNLNQPVSSASLPGGICTTNASSVTCTIAEIASGASRRLTVAATAQNAGPLFASAGVSVLGDGELSNNTASTTAWVQAERDVELSTAGADVDLAVNTGHDLEYTLRSRGVLPTGDVTLVFSLPAGLVVDALEAGGAPCTQPTATTWRCDIGAMPAGASRSIRLRVHGEGPVAGEVSVTALAAADGYAGNNTSYVNLNIDHHVDLGVTLASGGSGVEDTVFEGQVALRSNGRQPTTGATLILELHAAGALRSVKIHRGADCTLLTATRARCDLPTLARNASLYVDYTAEFAEPGNYDIRFVASAPGDTAPGNDSLTRAVLVRPFYDLGVAGSLSMTGLIDGQTREKTFTLTTDRRALSSARFVASQVSPALRVEAIAASEGACRVDADLGGICDFADLPAHASVSVSVTYRAAGAALVEPLVLVSTPGDVVSGNNSVSARVEVIGSTDVDLRVGGTLGGAHGATLSFPVIELVNGAHKAVTPRLEVTLPPQFTLVDVSALDAVCSGTTTVRCDFNSLEPNASATVNLSVMANANGSFISKVSVTTLNDSNPANDSRDVVLEISGGTVAASLAPATSRGGGRFEWLLLMLLTGCLVLRRFGHPHPSH